MPHISVVHVLVNAIGKNASSVFRFSKFLLSVICFGPSIVFVGKVKSGALVPTARGMTNQYRIDIYRVKETTSICHVMSRYKPMSFSVHVSWIIFLASPWQSSGGCS